MGLLTIFKVAGSLAFFIYGMKIMSDGIQRAAGVQFRLILRSLTRNRFLGFLTGIITTGAVQSSSATTVMTVGLVNAGLITLVQSAGLMIGANIGTTITAWIIAGIGFRVSLQQLMIPLLIVGVPLFFSNKGRLKFWGEFIIGFVILFLGLNFLSESIPDINQNQELLDWIKQYTYTGLFSVILFIAFGAVLTILIQSSSAAIALTMTVCLKGWLPFELGVAMILGENIGTTITAEIAALVGNIQARRSARVHSLFNIIGVLWMIVLLPLAISSLASIMEILPGVNNPLIDNDSTPIGLAIFHTTFNVLNAMLFLFFIKYLIRLAQWTVPDKSDGNGKEVSLISTSAMSPELAVLTTKKEISRYSERILVIHQDIISLINSYEKKESKKLIKNVRRFQEESSEISAEITNYITRVLGSKSSTSTSLKLRSFLDVCNDLERLVDIYTQIANDYKKKKGNKIWFTPQQKNSLNDLAEMTREALVIMNRNISSTKIKPEDLSKAESNYRQISEYRELLRNEYLQSKDLIEENFKGSIIYVNIVTLIQTLNNHIIHVSESLSREL